MSSRVISRIASLEIGEEGATACGRKAASTAVAQLVSDVFQIPCTPKDIEISQTANGAVRVADGPPAAMAIRVSISHTSTTAHGLAVIAVDHG